MKNRKLKICYFLPINSAHSRVFMDSLAERGHQLFYFCYEDMLFKDWAEKDVEENIIERNIINKWELRTITKFIFKIIPDSINDIIYYFYYLRYSTQILPF